MEHIFFYLSIALLSTRLVWEVTHHDGKLSPLAIYLFCYFYFCFGPYIANMLDLPIYSGIKKDYLYESSFAFFLAIATLSLFPANWVGKLTPHHSLVVKEPVLLRQIAMFFMLAPTMLLFLVAFSRIGFAPLDKVQRIQSVGIGHYVVLTLWPLFLFCYMTVMPRSSMSRKKFWQFSGVVLFYFTYCYYMGERDFALIVVPLYFWFYKDHAIALWKLLLGGTLGGFGFTMMSAGRSAEMDGGGLGSFLNQGSNLMVTSNIAMWLEQGDLVMWGESYFSGFINMLTLGAIRLTTPLSIWFSRRYSSAANDGAYGFSIEGEALLNFGYVGIPFLFTFIAIFLAWTYKGYLLNRPIGILLTYFNLFYFVYAIRGESLILFKAFIYCVIIFFLLLFVSQRGRMYYRV
ncbi:O-antigen polysaccharide polymerase Wzy [Aliiglaciecola litoralis]|uniref:Oligosaccharide repeat unit polymerase n=1 Tax=Aliiglaciecola litoralis TaxID=582857 RepID=A0ABN1LU38_9ALTE